MQLIQRRSVALIQQWYFVLWCLLLLAQTMQLIQRRSVALIQQWYFVLSMLPVLRRRRLLQLHFLVLEQVHQFVLDSVRLGFLQLVRCL